MASYVFLGHGAFDRQSGVGPPEVLVPSKTTLRFFSDSGQVLDIPATDEGTTDYNEVVNLWQHFQEDRAPIPPRWVTYNFALSPETSDEERELALSLDWGATVVSPPVGSEKLYLCTGTADSCPTPALNVQQRNHEAGREGAAAVPDKRWYHDCDGILDLYAGHDLFWIACTRIRLLPSDMPVLMTAHAPGPGLDDGSDWYPVDDTELTEIRQHNKNVLAMTPDGNGVALVVGGGLVLIGYDHAYGPASYVRRQDDTEEGFLLVDHSNRIIVVQGIGWQQQAASVALTDLFEYELIFADMVTT
jgi:hypothetical protein